MKRNIDLTEEMDFQKEEQLRTVFDEFPRRPSDSDLKWIDLRLSNRWGIDSTPHSYAPDSHGLFEVGTKEERQRSMRYHSYEDGSTCACCGIDLTTKPWDESYGLCSRCADSLEENTKNVKNELFSI